MDRVEFDDYIFQNFEQFLHQEGNHNVDENGNLYLKEGVDFRPIDILNRNKAIPKRLWQGIVIRHLHFINYN